jgi:hypothetical protein
VAEATLLHAAGCSDPLQVTNPNNPDRGRVLRRPTDVEALAGTLYQQVHAGTMGMNSANNTIGIYTQLLTAAFENTSGLANFGMGPRSGLPRGAISNVRGNPYSVEQNFDFSQLQRTARTSADILARLKDTTFTVGSRAGNLRLKAFTFFGYGVALGTAALAYDSLSIPRPTDGATEVPELEGARVVETYALQQLDSAIALAMNDTASASGGFPLPASWLPGNTFNAADFVRLVRSYKARLRAQVARTPQERAAVDWPAVIADAQAGIQSDFKINMDPSTGWDVPWLQTTLHFRDVNWHQMNYYIIGMADVSGAYDGWLATDRDTRSPFLIVTPDLRFPQGATRAIQNANPGKYLRNRPAGQDPSGNGWPNSQYDHYRFRAFADATRKGAFPVMTKAEIDMLAAEGLLRTGKFAEAATLIDRTRTVNGLAPVSGLGLTVTIDPAGKSTGTPVPGGAACVPRVPVAPAYTSTACGNLYEAMKWEKRMESAYAGYGIWFFDGRGWGDLPEGTALEWPVPFQEMDARTHPFYDIGGVGGRSAAAPSNYGFGSGNR